MSRVVVGFSCGAASAVAAKVAIERYKDERQVEVVYCDTSHDEHPDNARFLADVERWIERQITRLKNYKYSGIDDVFLTERYIVGQRGAACTKRLKRDMAKRFERPEDLVVLGYTADEGKRIRDIETSQPSRRFVWVLADAGITKADCYRIIQAAGIELPAMYKLGYDHNNCIGCVKGGMGYWNKIRRDFPEVFARRAAIEREVGAQIIHGVWLDELDPEAGREVKEFDIECGIYCASYTELLTQAVSSLRAEAEKGNDRNGIPNRD